jgi:hypothetical protein
LPTIQQVLQSASGGGDEAPDAIRLLEGHRRALARKFLLSNEPDEALAGRVHEIAPLANASFPWDPTLEDVDLAQAILERWRLSEAPPPNVLLATMALAPAHQFPIVPRLSAVPVWLRLHYVRYILALVPMFLHSGEADRYAAHGIAAMAMVHDAIFGERLSECGELADQAAETNSTLIYFNAQSLRPYFRHKARIIEWAMMRQGLSLGLGRRLTPGSRPRIGILHKKLSPCTETYHLLAHLEGRDRSAADVTIYLVERAANAMIDAFAPWVDGFVQLPAGARVAAARMRADRLDLCFIASNVSWGLSRESGIAAHRLATVQVASGASPATPGFSSSDLFLSSETNDPGPGAQDDYVERLAFLPGAVGHFAFAHDRDPPTMTVSRANFGVPDDHVLFFSGANYYKIQPEILEAWGEILARVPRSSLALVPFNPNWGGDYAVALFRRRLNGLLARFGVGANRVRVIDQVPTRADLLSVMALTDIYLDSFPYSGACSLVDPLTVGLPIVARAGERLRTAQGSGLLRGEGLESAVCPDTPRYIQRAVRLALDPAFRAAARERASIVARRPACLSTHDFAARFQSFCLEAIAEADRRTAWLRREPAPNLRQAIVRVADLALNDPAPQFAFARDTHLLEQIAGPYLAALAAERGAEARVGCVGDRAVKAAAGIVRPGVAIDRLGDDNVADVVVIDEPGVTLATLRRLNLNEHSPKAIAVCFDESVARRARKGVERAAVELAAAGFGAIAFQRTRPAAADWRDEIAGVVVGAEHAGDSGAGLVFFYREADSTFLACVLGALEMACPAPLRPADVAGLRARRQRGGAARKSRFEGASAARTPS